MFRAESTITVAVVGVGSMGAMAMWMLAESGISVTGYEQFSVPHDHGAHGAETRIYRMAYREGAEYLPLLEFSRGRWQRLAAESRRPLFLANGCLYISDRDHQWLSETGEAATSYGVPVVELSDAQLSERYPQHRLQGGERGLLDLLGGTLRPEQAVLAAMQAALDRGAVLREGCVVRDVVPGRESVSVVSDDGHREAFDYVIITTGAWSTTFQAEHGFGVKARRLPATWYPALHPADFAPDRFPVCIRTAGETEYSGFPSVDGWSVKVMPPVLPNTETNTETVDREVRPSDADYTRRVVRELLNGLVDSPARSGVYLDGFGVGTRPLIDRSVESGRLLGAVGFAGHGFKFSPAVGRLLADLILEHAGGSPSELLGAARAFRRSTAEAN